MPVILSPRISAQGWRRSRPGSAAMRDFERDDHRALCRTTRRRLDLTGRIQAGGFNPPVGDAAGYR